MKLRKYLKGKNIFLKKRGLKGKSLKSKVGEWSKLKGGGKVTLPSFTYKYHPSTGIQFPAFAGMT
jgi:hypothetical protein